MDRTGRHGWSWMLAMLPALALVLSGATGAALAATRLDPAVIAAASGANRRGNWCRSTAARMPGWRSGDRG